MRRHFSPFVNFDQEIKWVPFNINSWNRCIFSFLGLSIDFSAFLVKDYVRVRCSPTLSPVLFHPFGRSNVKTLVSWVISLTLIKVAKNDFFLLLSFLRAKRQIKMIITNPRAIPIIPVLLNTKSLVWWHRESSCRSIPLFSKMKWLVLLQRCCMLDQSWLGSVSRSISWGFQLIIAIISITLFPGLISM